VCVCVCLIVGELETGDLDPIWTVAIKKQCNIATDMARFCKHCNTCPEQFLNR
jgi:hypothetical protein